MAQQQNPSTIEAMPSAAGVEQINPIPPSG